MALRSGRSRTSGGGSVGEAPTARKGFGGTNAGKGGEKRSYFNQRVKMVEFPANGSFLAMRMISDPIPDVSYRISITTPKGDFEIPFTPLNFDREADTFDTTIECPFENIANPKKVAKHYYILVIVRELQDSEPRRLPELSANEKKTGYFDSVSSSSWSPVRVLRLTDRMAGKVGKLEETNKVKTKKGVMVMPLADAEYGRDILMSYDKNAKSASDTYDVQLDNSTKHTALTRTEKGYLKWDIMKNLDKPMDYKTAVAEVEKLEAKAPEAEEVAEEGEKAGKDLDRSSRRTGKRESDRPLRSSRRGKEEKEDKPARSSRLKSTKSSRTGKSSVSDKPVRSTKTSRTSRLKSKR